MYFFKVYLFRGMLQWINGIIRINWFSHLVLMHEWIIMWQLLRYCDCLDNRDFFYFVLTREARWNDDENAKVLARWCKHDGTMMKKINGTMVKTWCYIEFSSSYYRHLTIAISPSRHRVSASYQRAFTIVPSCFHHRVIAFTTVSSSFHHLTIAFSPSCSPFYHHTIAFLPSCQRVFIIVPSCC
jgi:hypothetical protein